MHSDCLAFVSIFSILEELKNKTLTIIDVKNLSIERDLYVIQPQGDQSAIIGVFLSFAHRYNFK
jgi:hypothetical protein